METSGYSGVSLKTTFLDSNFGFPFQSMSFWAQSWGIPVIQHYPTLIDINNVNVDLAYCFGMMSPFQTLTLIVYM